MNVTDQLILSRARGYIAEPPESERPAAGESYYWDARGPGVGHRAAVGLARRQMGQALASLAVVRMRG